MANNYQIKDGNGSLVTFLSYDSGSGVQLAESCPHDGTNKLSRLFDLDSSGLSHEYNLGVGLRLSAAGGTMEAKGQQAMANSIPVVIAANQSAIPVSQSGNFTVAQNGTWTVATNADCAPGPGTAPAKALLAAGIYNSLLPTLANGQSAGLQTDSSGRLLVGSIASPLPAGSNVIGAVTITQPLPAGANTIGNTVPVPASSGGLSTYRVLWPGNSTGINIKASAGQVYGWYLYNNATAIRVVKLYDKATAPATGSDTPSQTIVLPPNGGATVFTDLGIVFSNGIGIAVTTGIPDSDSGAPAANDVILNLFYK